MARRIPIEFLDFDPRFQIISVHKLILDEVDNPVNTESMTCGSSKSSGCGFGQNMVDQTPKYENSMRKRKGRRENQVVGKSGIIRPDRRKKAKYL